MTYQELYEQACKRILHQNAAVKQLAAVLYYHLKSAKEYECYHLCQNLEKQIVSSDPSVAATIGTQLQKPETIGTAPIFLLGKTGSGKTHLVRELCAISGVNFLAVNATHISNAGHKGMTLAEIGEMLLKNANDYLPKALFSVVFFDEFDKLFVATNEYQASYHRALATELLTILEGTSPFPVKGEGGIESGYMLFVLGGSFGLHAKDTANAIGFMIPEKGNDLPKNQLDLLKMGFFEELAGRIGQIISLAPLDELMLGDILLNSPSSPLVRLTKQLALEGHTLELDRFLLERLIKNNSDAIEKFGVRGLYQAFIGLPQISEVLVAGATSQYSQAFVLKEEGITSEPISSYEEDELAFLGVEITSISESKP